MKKKKKIHPTIKEKIRNKKMEIFWSVYMSSAKKIRKEDLCIDYTKDQF